MFVMTWEYYPRKYQRSQTHNVQYQHNQNQQLQIPNSLRRQANSSHVMTM